MTVGITRKASVYLVAETHMRRNEMQQFLNDIGAKDWKTDARCDASELIEVAGRLCYKSFGTELNPNLTKVREGNAEYLGNVRRQKHGSVFEHAYVSVIFRDVSRILTHELVRHRLANVSQESQRFVRLDNFSVYIPELTPALETLYEDNNPTGTKEARDLWVQEAQADYADTLKQVAEEAQHQLTLLVNEWGMDKEGVSFHTKKQLTSALRRFVPGGVNTNIMLTGNHRNWRHIIEQRTSPGAEQEIVEAYMQVARRFITEYPEIYADIMCKQHEDNPNLFHYSFKHQKI